MDNTIIKNILPHIGAYVLLAAISFLFFLPYFQGKTLKAGDIVRAQAQQTESKQIQERDGTLSLWTNSSFSGMPTFQIMQPGRGNFTKTIHRVMMWFQGIDKPHFVLLVAMSLSYLLLITLKMDWRIALIGAIGYGLSTYFIDLSEAGHNSKMLAMAWVPGVYAGVFLAFRGKYILGASLFALCFSINIYANHYQITFYMMLLLVIWGVIQLISAFRNNELAHFSKASGVLILALLLGLAANLSRIWTTQEYSKETIRGKSELSSKAGKGDGLDKNYIFAWSYGLMESFTLLVPNFNGGGASHTFKGTKTYKQMYKNMESQFIKGGNSKQAAQKSAEKQIASLFYWGKQPFVGVAIYFGAVLLFLFFIGAFLVKGDMKVWLIASAFFALSIAWGNNFFLNEIFVDYFPLFNKFRAVSMALGLSQLSVIILAMLGLSKLVDKNVAISDKKKALMLASGITLGLCVIAFLLGSMTDMTGKNDSSVASQLGAQFTEMIKKDRMSILQFDVMRSIGLILLSAGLVWAYLTSKIKSLILVILIGLISVGEVWMVNKRVLFASKYEKVKTNSKAIPSVADKQIMQDPDPHYRVLDLSKGNPFENALTSNFHKSIGGYHAAKLMRYQDLIENYLSKPSSNLHILGMLNTKYIIQGEGGKVTANKIPQALGNAWFVDEFQVVENGDAEMKGLADLDPAKKALVQKSYAKGLESFNIQPDPSASIKLTSYHPDKMQYEYSAATDQLAVFSEIYYPPSKGWNLYLDGQPYESMIKANFLLRAAKVPAGNHKLEMRFEPKSFAIGEIVSKITSLIILLGFLGSLYLYFKSGEMPKANLLDDEEIGTDNSGSKSKVAPTVSKTVKEKKKKKKKS